MLAGIIVIAAGAVFGADVLGSAPRPTGPAESADVSREARPIRVETFEAERSDGFEVARSYTGELTARRRSSLAFERLGLLIEVARDDGDVVAKGEIVARLDDRHLVLARKRVEASLAQARAVLEELEAGPRRQAIDAARSAVADLDAQIEWAQVRRDRREKLVRQDALAKEEVEGVSLEQDALVARRDGAAARLDELEEGTRTEQVAAQRARVLELVARLDEIDLDIEKSRIVAPFDGRVSSRLLDEGAVVSPGAAVLELVERGVLEARIGIPAGEDDAWKPGARIAVELDGRELDATLRGYESDLDRLTRSRIAILEVPESDTLSPGRIVRVRRSRRVEEAGFWLPRSALVKSLRGLWACLVVVDDGTDEVVERRALEVLHDTDDRVFVRGTLAVGEKVVAGGTHRVVEGQAVESGEKR